MTKIFISHAGHDKVLTDSFVDLLEMGVGISHGDIFYTSGAGQGVEPGEKFIESIRRSLGDAECVLAIITEAYYASAFCMCELGGVWLQSKKNIIPVIVRPINTDNLKAVLGELQVLNIESEKDLDDLRDVLIKRLDIVDAPKTARWSERKGAFLGGVAEKIQKTKFEGPVERKVHSALIEKFKQCREISERLRVETEKKESQIEKLSAIKEEKAVRVIMQEGAPAVEEFTEMVNGVRAAMSKLNHATREALFYHWREDSFQPEGSEEWRDVKIASEYEELIVDEDEGTVSINSKNAKVKKAIDAINEVKELMNGPRKKEIDAWYRSVHDGETPSIKSRSFWSDNFRG